MPSRMVGCRSYTDIVSSVKRALDGCRLQEDEDADGGEHDCLDDEDPGGEGKSGHSGVCLRFTKLRA